MSSETGPEEEHQSFPLPPDLSQYDRLEAMVAADGSRRVYGVERSADSDTDQPVEKRTQLKGDDVLAAYGYEPDDQRHHPEGEDEPEEESEEISRLREEVGELHQRVNELNDKLDRVLQAIEGPPASPPPGPPTPGPVPPVPGPPIEQPPEPGTGEAEPATPEGQAYDQALARWRESVGDYSKARVAGEKLTAGKAEKAVLVAAEQRLAETHEQLLAAHANAMRIGDQSYGELVEIQTQQLASRQAISEQLTSLNAQKAAAGEAYDGSLDALIQQHEAQLQQADTIAADLQMRINLGQAEIQAYGAQTLINLRQGVDEAMLKEREQQHPVLGKVIHFINKHPKARMALSLGMVGLGIAGAVTANPVLVGVSVAGRWALRGVGTLGTYEMVSGIADKRAQKRMDGTNISTLDQYLEAARKESTTRRRGKVGGVVAGAAFAGLTSAAASGVFEGAHHAAGLEHHQTSGTEHHAAAPTQPEQPPQSAQITEVPAVDGSDLPWSHMANTYGINLTDQGTLDKLIHNPFGVTVTGNEAGNGFSITLPDGVNYADSAHINGFLDQLVQNGWIERTATNAMGANGGTT